MKTQMIQELQNQLKNAAKDYAYMIEKCYQGDWICTTKEIQSIENKILSLLKIKYPEVAEETLIMRIWKFQEQVASRNIQQ